MPRKAVLDDHQKRNRVIRVLRDGGDNGAAAKEIGISRQSLQNYIAANPEFAERVDRAREQGMMIDAVARDAVAPPIEPPPPTGRPAPPPSRDAVIAADVMGMDADLVADIDDILADDLIELSTVVDLRRPSARGYIEVCWRRFISNRDDAAIYGRLMEKVITGPTLKAQIRRDAAAARRELLAEQRANAEAVEGGKAAPRGAGMVVLEAPPNPARPFMARKDDQDPVDAEVVD